MSVLVADIVAMVQEITHDDGTRYPNLLRWIDEAQRTIVNMKPDASCVNVSMALAVGAKQVLPDAAIQLLTVVRNMDGVAPGRTVEQVQRGVLDSYNPNWHSDTPTNEVLQFCAVDKDPRTFYVYPPSDGTASVEVVYTVAPDSVIAGGNIGVNDLLSPAIVDYCLYRCHQMDADPQMAQMYYQTFMQAVGVRTQNEDAGFPKVGENG